MKLRLRRIALMKEYTVGKLEVWKNDQWVYLCDTIEDAIRDISMYAGSIGSKIPKHTAIPFGVYSVTMNVVSPQYSNYSEHAYTRLYNGYIPRLINVEGFDGILILPGATQKSAKGSILVGENTIIGRLTNSQTCWHSLMQHYFMPAKKNKEPITIEII